MIVLESHLERLSSNNRHLDRKACKIKVLRSCFLFRDVNLMLKNCARTFITLIWIVLKFLSDYGNISLGLPGW